MFNSEIHFMEWFEARENHEDTDEEEEEKRKQEEEFKK